MTIWIYQVQGNNKQKIDKDEKRIKYIHSHPDS